MCAAVLTSRDERIRKNGGGIAAVSFREQMENIRKLILEDESGTWSVFYPVLSEDGCEFGRRKLPKTAKIISARKMLRELDRYHDRIFREEFRSLDTALERKKMFFNSSLVYFIDATDSHEDALGHSQFVSRYAVLLAKALGIGEKGFLQNLERGALLHDIGKIGVPESILRKAGPLTAMEREIIKDHPWLGYKMIEGFGFLRAAAQVVLHHHERFDGKGYPCGLGGSDIPLGARIFSLADTLDAITSDRPYRGGKSFEAAIREIEKSSGTQFDPMIVDVFLSIPKEKWHLAKVQAQHSLCLPEVH